MRTFVRIAERGNLAAVARETGSGQSTITRHLRELEEALGVSLLTRTTRRSALTEEGMRYYAQCLQILCLVEQASQEMRQTRQATAGTVRISCTAALGVLHVSRLLFAFQDVNPGIRVEFSLTDERVDLVREGVDIAIRLGPLTDSSMKLRSLGESQRVNEHLRHGKALLLDFGGSDLLRMLADRYRNQLSYIACDAKDGSGLSALLIRPDGFVAWASDHCSDGSGVVRALSQWLVAS